MIRTVLILAQAATFIGLAGVLFLQGEWKLGLAQTLLAGVTVLVYTT